MCLRNKRHLDDYFTEPFVSAILSMCFNSKRQNYKSLEYMPQYMCLRIKTQHCFFIACQIMYLSDKRQLID